MPQQRKGTDNPRALTPRQEKFIAEYVKHGNATQAYRDAGYSTQAYSDRALFVQAWKVLHAPKVAEAIQAIKLRTAQKIENSIVLNKAYVLSALVENVETGLGRKKLKRSVVTADGSTVDVEMIQPDRAVVARSAELLGKELAMFVDRKEIGNPGDFERMSNDDLDAWLSQARCEAIEHKPDQE